jgi:hypothetical protein
MQLVYAIQPMVFCLDLEVWIIPTEALAMMIHLDKGSKIIKLCEMD